MTPEQLREGAALLAAAETSRTDGALPMTPEDAEWYGWCDDHAAELLADAGRWQWLRDKTRKDVGFTLTDIGSRIAVRNFPPDYLTLDAAIDAARASGAEEP